MSISKMPTKTDADSVPGDSLDQRLDIQEARADVIRPEKPFKLLSTLGIAYSITSTPLAIGTYLSVAIGVGGSPVFFFGFVLTVVMSLCICLSLAEMAAVLPHSGGKLSQPANESIWNLTHFSRSNFLDGTAGKQGSGTWAELRRGLAHRCSLLLLVSSMLPHYLATHFRSGPNL